MDRFKDIGNCPILLISCVAVDGFVDFIGEGRCIDLAVSECHSNVLDLGVGGHGCLFLLFGVVEVVIGSQI